MNCNLETSLNYGSLLKPISSMGYLIKGHTNAFDLKFSKATNGDHLWEQLFRYPEIGIGIYGSNIGNPKILGNVFAAYEYIRIPILINKKTSFNYQLEAGISYLTKKFDVNTNYYNIAISTNLNVYIGFILNFEYNLSQKLNIISSIDYAHFSNGSFGQPNLGLNIISYQMGIKYKIQNNKSKIVNIIPEFERTNKFVFNYSIGFKAINPPEKSKYFITSFSFNYQRMINNKRSIGIGTDIFYDMSLYDRDCVDFTYLDLIRTGIYLSHEVFFGNTSIVTQFGAYIYQNNYSNGDFYSRFGIRKKISTHFSANIFLHTHFASAYFIEWGIGYHF